MRYKLKEHVTDEMLIDCGFLIHGEHYKFANRNYDEDYQNALYISLSKDYSAGYYREVSWNLANKTDDITPYIQDLINLCYVEKLK